MTLEERILKSMQRMLVNRGIDSQEVTSYYEDTYSDGYCETCYYEYDVVRINYIDSDGKAKEYVYSESFGSLIQELTDED